MASNAVLAPSHPVVVTIVQVNGVRTIRTSPLICRGDDVYRSGGRLAAVRVPGGNRADGRRTELRRHVNRFC